MFYSLFEQHNKEKQLQRQAVHSTSRLSRDYYQWQERKELQLWKLRGKYWDSCIKELPSFLSCTSYVHLIPDRKILTNNAGIKWNFQPWCSLTSAGVSREGLSMGLGCPAPKARTCQGKGSYSMDGMAGKGQLFQW